MIGKFFNNNIAFSKSKTFQENGISCKIIANISINDDCNNGIFDFSVTGKILNLLSNNRDKTIMCGRIDKEIIKHFPELEIFISLANCNIHGYPTHLIENGIYFIKMNEMDNAKSWLRISDEELQKIAKYYEYPEYIKYLLFTMGIFDRYQFQADNAIAIAEEISGKKFINPYSIDEERFTVKPFTTEEINTISKHINNGYYSDTAIEQRKIEKIAKERKLKIETINNAFNNTVKYAEKTRDIKMYMLDFPLTNWIYYESSNTIGFNWASCEKKVTQADWDEFVKTHKKPDNLDFKVSFKK